MNVNTALADGCTSSTPVEKGTISKTCGANATCAKDYPLCTSICNDAGFNMGNKSQCLDKANKATEKYTKYSLSRKKYEVTVTCVFGWLSNITYQYIYSFFDPVELGDVCSTGDKCPQNTCPGSGTTLRSGYCNCSVGDSYKKCCVKEGNAWVAAQAQKYTGASDDGIKPDEGTCTPASTFAGTVCPAPMTVSLYLNNDLNLTSTNVEEKTPFTLNWASTNTKSDSCTITGYGFGVTNNNTLSSTDGVFIGGSKAVGISGSLAVGTSVQTRRTVARSKAISEPWIFVQNTSGNNKIVARQTDFAVQDAPYIYTINCSRTYNNLSGTDVSTSASAQVEVYYGVQAPTCHATLTASPAIIALGDSSTLTWVSTEANSCTLSGESVPISGSRIVSPETTTTYNLSCNSTDGSGACTNAKTVTVSTGECPYTHDESSVSSNISASSTGGEACIGENGQVTITWGATTPSTCLNGGTPSNRDITCKSTGPWSLNESGSGSIGGTLTVTPSGSGSFGISCTRAQYTCNEETYCPTTKDASTQSFTYFQAPRFTTDGLTTDPKKTQILLNQTVNLVWSVASGVEGANLTCVASVASGDGTGWSGSVSTSGSKTLSPKVSTVYQLTCTNTSVDNPDCSNSVTSQYEVKVYTPDLKEVPAFRNGFINFVGTVFEGLKTIIGK